MRDVHAVLRLALVAALGACGGQIEGGNDSGAASCNPKQTSPMPSSSCGGSYTMSISGASACGINPTNGPTTGQCSSICATGTQNCLLTNDTTVTCSVPFCGKARTSMRVRRGRATIAKHLRDSVTLEAASVGAFERLERELEAHGAPIGLRRAARAAARDESRHARAMTRLARRHGVRARAKTTRESKTNRALVDVAIENAVEGCVHETFGAVLARFQAERAPDPRDRAVLRDIARDEARHAALAERIDAWVKPRLTFEERRRVDDARANAANAIVCATPRAPHFPKLGTPTAREVDAMARSLAARLWS
ncbi:MAG TPA: ferritin-like domain-containing protein [Polyangiaceae bacterium]